jgi:hypothetical protein
MFRTRSDRWKNRALRLATSAFLLLGSFTLAIAQEPPLDVPRAGRLGNPTDALTFGEWVLYPAIHTFSVYSNNYFMSPSSPISAFGFGIGPSLTAEWTNGIHSTTLYGSSQQQVFPTDNDINQLDRNAGIVQKYSPLPDLVFKAQVDYQYHNIAPGLTNSIPTPTVAPQTSTLPNGNIVLPNGTIISPTGQIVGQTTPALSVGQISIVNPYNLYTGTVSVDKILNGGVVGFSSSIAQQDYTNSSTPNLSNSPTPNLMSSSPTPNFMTRTFGGYGAFWLGPIFYVYSNGATSTYSPTLGAETTSFRAVGGLGFRLNPMLGGSGYYGRQGSQSEGSEPSGGEVYGGRVTYQPTPDWTFNAGVDVTVNIAPAGAPSSTLALTIPVPLPLQIPLGSSTQVTATSFSATYLISQQWTLTERLNYAVIDYIGGPRVDNTWLADTLLSYQMLTNLTLTWDYQFSSIDSNAPQVGTWRHYVNVGATYKF